MKQVKRTISLLLFFTLLFSVTGIFPAQVKAAGFAMNIQAPTDGGTYSKGEPLEIRVDPSMVSYVNNNYVQIQILKNGKEVDFLNIFYNSLNTVSASYTPKSTGTYTIKAGYSPVSQSSWYGTPSDSVKIKVIDPKEAIGKIKPALTVFRFSQNDANLKWEYMSGYKMQIFRSTSKTKGFKKIKTVSDTNYFEDQSISGSGTFYYKIRLSKKIDSKTYYSQFSDVKTADTKGIPEIKSLTYTKGKGVKITWTASSFADVYFIIREKGTEYEFLGEVKAGKTSFTDKTAKPGKTYYYEVKAYNNKQQIGKASQEKKIRIPK